MYSGMWAGDDNGGELGVTSARTIKVACGHGADAVDGDLDLILTTTGIVRREDRKRVTTIGGDMRTRMSVVHESYSRRQVRQ